MPISFLDVPAGIRADAKQKLFRTFTDVLEQTFRQQDVRIFFREYRAEDAVQDGQVRAASVRPVCTLNVPPFESLGAKRALSEKLQAALSEAYRGIANTDEFVIFYNHYPPDSAAVGGRLFSDRLPAVKP